MMGKKVAFYNVGVYKNNILTNISFLDILNGINSIQKDRLKVVRIINDEIVGVFGFIPQKDPNNVLVPMGKFRINFKPYIGEITQSDFNEIDKKVIEINTLYYDHTYNTACINFTQYGLKLDDIEEYFNTFFPVNQNEKWEVKFEPIIINKGIEKIKKSKQVKSIVLHLNLKNSSKKYIKEGIHEKVNFIKAFSDNIETEFDANILKLEFGIGMKKNKTMDIDNVLYLLSVLNIDTQYISKLEVKYKDSSSDEVDTVNLKTDKVELNDYILKNYKGTNPGIEVIGEDIKQKLDKHKSSIVRSFRHFKNEMKENGMPDLLYTPNEKHKIKVNE